jgi:hypothetical protein
MDQPIDPQRQFFGYRDVLSFFDLIEVKVRMCMGAVQGLWVMTRRAVLLMGLFTACVMSLAAQSYQGSIRGKVTDATGSVVAHATVVLTDQASKLSRTVGTNNDGEYVFGALEPATYTLSLDQPGFKKFAERGVIVAAQQFETIDIALAVGSTGETVEVTSSAPLIDATTASNGQNIDTQQLEDLPNLGRNPFLFAKLSTNVAAVGDPRFNRFQDQSGSSQISIAGGPVRANNYLIDGVPITDANNRAVIIPSLEATQEVKLQANTYDAEIARTGGGIFNTVLKSGTNALHGTLYGETRQTNWAAHPYTYTAGAPYSATYYTYAGAVGGPVVIPHVYNGKNKTFFHFTEEGYRQRSPLSGTFYIPGAAERTGNFSGTQLGTGSPDGVTCPNATPAAPNGTCILDPLSGTAAGVTNGSTKYFKGNIIPAARINPIGQALINAYPAAGTAGLASYPTTGTYESPNFSGTDLLGDRADEFIGKVDHQVFKWWYANFAYMHYGSKEPGGDPLHSFAGDESPQSSYLLFRKVDAISQNDTFTINPTTIATLGFGFNRFPNSFLDLSNGFDATTLGFSPSLIGGLPKKSFPALVMLNAATNGTSNSGPSVYYSRSINASIAKTLGTHEVKAGYDFRTVSLDFTDVTYSNGQLYFDNSYSGYDLVNLLLGFPTSKTSSVATTTQFSIPTRLALNLHYNAIYAQDSWRVVPKLTLNYGLRYEYEPGIYERNNHYVVGFDRFVKNPTAALPNAIGGVEFAGQNGYATHCCSYSNLKFAPRAGFAYAATERTVLRGGYGIFFAPPYYTASSALAPGYTATNVYQPYTPASASGASAPLSNLFPAGLQQPVGNSLGYATQQGSTVTALDQYRRYAVVNQYSADMQQQFGFGLAFKLGYVGAHGKNLQASTTGTTGYNIDQLPDQYMQQYTIAQLGSTCASLGATAPAPCAGVSGATTLNTALRPYQAFSSVTVLGSPARSNYNSMIVRLEKAPSHGLSLLTSFTWSSNWDSVFGTTSTINSGISAAQDANNLKAEYARAIDDIPLRFSVGATYELPFGRGRQFLNHNRLLDLAVGGWSIQTIGVKQSGSPLSPSTNSNGIAAIGASVQHVSYNPSFSGVAGRTGRAEGRTGIPGTGKPTYFNTGAFTSPAIAAGDTTHYYYGNVARTISALGPGLDSFDVSIFKTKKLERATLQFRAEALNVSNTPQFGAPNVKYGSTSFGVINTQVNLPRYIQLGGRIDF